MNVKTNTTYEVLRIWAEALYDHQDIRMGSLNRVRSLVRRKLLDLGFKVEAKKTKKAVKEPTWTDTEIERLLETAKLQKKLSQADYNFLHDSFELAQKETSIEIEYENHLEPLIAKEKIWKDWLIYVNGISTRNACRLLRYFGYCERFDTVSKLWAYSGLKVVDGHSVRRVKGEQLDYNLKIKTGCLGVIGESLIKANKSYKKRIYDVYKKRIQTRGCCENKHPKHKGKKCKDYPGHAANMARRKMVKIFLEHYWMQCREIKKLPTGEPFIIGKPKGKKGVHTTYIKPFYDKKPDEV